MIKEIQSRRSCRKFDAQRAVEKDKISEIVRAGLLAPSGMNTQNGIVVVITQKQTRDKLAALNSQIMGRTGDPFYGAPVVLLVAVKKWATDVYDGSIMIQNMMLEATEQGLGSCWIHRAKEELESEQGKQILSCLGLNLDDYVGVGHVALGYSLVDAYPEKKIKEGREFWIE